MKVTVRLNSYDYIKVKPGPAFMDAWMAYWEPLRGTPCGISPPKIDEDGYVKMSLTQICTMFGPYVRPGMLLPFTELVMDSKP